MITRRLTLSILTGIFICSHSVAGTHHRNERPTFIRNKAHYTDSIVKGTAIGLFSGTWCALTDIATGGIYFPVTWAASFGARKALVYPVLDSYEHDEAHLYRDAIDTSAWISSWASYIIAGSLFLNHKLTPYPTIIDHRHNVVHRHY